MLGDCHVTITGKHIDGTFPDYQRIMPANNPLRASFDAADMQEALRAVSLISSERGRAARYTFTDGKCDLEVTNPDSGSAKSSIACEFVSDADPRDGFEIGFNSSYMTAILTEAAGDGESVQFHLSEPGSPALITGDREGWTGVLMPMRV
jgi:DNA polymerase-3 subunit beta